MGKRQEEVALKFIGYFKDTWPENFDDPLSLVADECYYQGIMPATDKIVGKEAIKKKWHQIRDETGDQRHDMLGVGSSDRLVFTERTDYSCINGKWISIPLVAVFEVNEDNKIVAWREYLDPANVARQMNVDVEWLMKHHASE